MSKIYFKEEQRFRSKILWIFLSISIVAAVVLYGIAFWKQIILDQNVGSKNQSDTVVIFAFLLTIVFSVVLVFFFLKTRLNTFIDEKGIHYKFWPFIRTNKNLPFNQIKSIEVGKYSPIKEYGGWGYRFSLRGNGIGLNTSGNQGVRVEMKDGYKILLGTQKKEELKNALKQLNIEFYEREN